MGKRGMTPEQAKELRERKGIKPTKLQKMRVRKGLSQKGLSDKSKVAKYTIQHYERNSSVSNIDCAKLETLLDLCIALDCKLEDILEDETLINKYKQVK